MKNPNYQKSFDEKYIKMNGPITIQEIEFVVKNLHKHR